MIRLVILSASALALVGCAADGQVYKHGLVGQKVVGNEVSVSVSNVWKQADALPLAEAHCGKFGKIAKMGHMEGYTAVFECVAKA